MSDREPISERQVQLEIKGAIGDATSPLWKVISEQGTTIAELRVEAKGHEERLDERHAHSQAALETLAAQGRAAARSTAVKVSGGGISIVALMEIIKAFNDMGAS